MLSMYFYLGGRLTPILVIAVVGYLFLLMPLVRLPGVYGELRRAAAGAGAAARRWAGRSRTQVRGVSRYYAARSSSSPSPASASPRPGWSISWTTRPSGTPARNDKLIFNNAGAHGRSSTAATHDRSTSACARRAPTMSTPAARRLRADADQHQAERTTASGRAPCGARLTTTLSILTYRWRRQFGLYLHPGAGGQAHRGGADHPGHRLGACGAGATRAWPCSRSGSGPPCIVGGVLTIDAPYMARLVGIIPTLADLRRHPAEQAERRVHQRAGRSRALGRDAPRAARWPAARSLAAMLLWLFGQNYTDYYFRYVRQLRRSPK